MPSVERRTKPRALAKPKAATPRILPEREWDRGTELVKLFVATGWIQNSRPQSVLLVSDPGSGKTELLDRFRPNRNCDYHSDLTVRQLWPVLKKAQRGLITHVVFPELQKLFQRKMSVAENLLGTLVQAMEEGVHNVSVGPEAYDFDGTRLGVIGAVTNGTITKKREMLSEMGFLSRAAVFRWDLPPLEEEVIMRRISDGDMSDILPIRLDAPTKPIKVELPPPQSYQLEAYVKDRRGGRALRFFNRLRSLSQAAALLAGRDVVNDSDIDWIMAFDPYWKRMIDA